MIFSKNKLSATSYDLPSARSDNKGVVSPHINDQSIGLYRNPKYRQHRNFWMMRRELDIQDVQELQDVVQELKLGVTRTFPVKPIGENLLRSH